MTAPTMKPADKTTGDSTHEAQPGSARQPAAIESPILGTYKRAPVEFIRGSGVHL